MKFKNHYNAEPEQGQKHFAPSQTIPDQSMSVAEIMRRHARGLPITGERVPLYHGEDVDLPDLQHMDLADRQQWTEDTKAELDEINQRLADKAQKEQKAKEEAKKPKINDSIEEAEIIEENTQPEKKPKK